MAQAVFYEWIVEELDEHNDIKDVSHYDTYREARDVAKDMPRVDIALVRDDLRDHDRSWAYVNDGQLPAVFAGSDATPNGVKVLQRFIDEVRKVEGK